MVEQLDVSQRLRQLETRQVWMVRGFLLLTFVAGVTVISGSAALQATKSMEAKSFTVVDDKGQKLAFLGPHPDQPGAVALILYEGEKGRVILAASEQDASVSLIENDQLRGAFNARKGKHAMLLFQKEKFDQFRNQMALGYTDDGKPMLFVNDANGKTTAVWPTP